jgi:hypothetical protein
MSYSRWSNSSWYSFYNVENTLSLWYNMNNLQDWTYEECLSLTETNIINYYKCTQGEAQEAMQYVLKFIKHYKERNELSKKI